MNRTRLFVPHPRFHVTPWDHMAQPAQHNTSKKWETHKFQSLLNEAYKTVTRSTDLGAKYNEATSTDVQKKWAKNPSHRSLTKPERDVQTKRLNFTISPQQLSIVDLVISVLSEDPSITIFPAEKREMPRNPHHIRLPHQDNIPAQRP